MLKDWAIFVVVMFVAGVMPSDVYGWADEGVPAYTLYAIASGDNSGVSDEDLRGLATQFSFVYGKFSQEQMDRMREINPDFRVLSYINTWNFGGSEMQPYAEGRRGDLEHYLVGFLDRDIGAGQRRIGIKAFFDDYPPRLRASTIEGNVSSTDRSRPAGANYVTWLRIGDELMRIEDFDSETLAATVTRGFDGTEAIAHEAGEAVCHPTYSSNGVPGDPKGEFVNRDGWLCYIADPASTLRWDMVRDLTLERVGMGYDGVWIDCLGSISFGAVDVFAKNVNSKRTHKRSGEGIMEGWGEASHHRRVWNFREKRPYDYNDHREHCEIGLDRVYGELERELGYVPMICANNIGPGYYPKMGDRKRYMMSTEVKPRPLDAYCMEGFVGGIGTEQFNSFLRANSSRPGPTMVDVEGWRVQVGILMDAYQDGLCAAPMMTQAGWKTRLFEVYDDEMRQAYELYAYASFLLAVEKDAPAMLGRPAFGGMDEDRRVKIYPHYYWPIGEPAETKKGLEDYRAAGHVSYWRRFSNGLVIVNPSDSDDNGIVIDPPLIDPATGKKVRSVDMGPNSGKILLDELNVPGTFNSGGNVFSVRGSEVVLNGRAFKVIGLRCSNALISEATTQRLIDNLDDFKSYGVNTVSVFFMGSRFGDVQGYRADSTLDPVYAARMGRIIEAADERGMVVVVGCLYWSTSRAKEELDGVWGQADANRAVANTVRWLSEHDYRNVFVDPDNEGMAHDATGWSIASMIDAAHAVDESIMIAYNDGDEPPANADLYVHHSPKVAGRPWLDSESTPKEFGYWGDYSKETARETDGEYYNYSRIGRYTTKMKAVQLAQTRDGMENHNGIMLASTWLQCVGGEGIGGPFMTVGGQSNIDDVDADIDTVHSDAGIGWWLEYVRDRYGPGRSASQPN